MDVVIYNTIIVIVSIVRLIRMPHVRPRGGGALISKPLSPLDMQYQWDARATLGFMGVSVRYPSARCLAPPLYSNLLCPSAALPKNRYCMTPF